MELWIQVPVNRYVVTNRPLRGSRERCSLLLKHSGIRLLDEHNISPTELWDRLKALPDTTWDLSDDRNVLDLPCYA